MAGPSFGILLKFFQKAGFFPCKKVAENDKTCLEPINGCIQFSKLFSCWLCILCVHVASFWIPYSSSSNYENFLDFLTDFYMTGFSLNGSIFDIVLNICLYPFLIGQNVMIIWKSFRARGKLCEVYNYLEHHASSEAKLLEKDYILHILKIALLVTGQGFFIIGFGLNILEKFSFGFISIVPYFLWYFISVPFLHAPLMAVHLYFLEMHWKLQSWMNSLKKSSGIDNHLNQCNQLAKVLNMISDTLSEIVFWLFTFFLLLSTIETYTMINFILTHSDFSVATIFLMIGFGFYGMYFLYFAYSYCILSQSIKDSADDIKIILKKTDINKEMKSREQIFKKQIEMELKKFQGFHGNGYFILGKPLLTSVVANIITYLIILIQFKVSELSSQ